MDLEQLQTFLTVVELQSFTKASHKLHVTQPTVTSRIFNLESEMECKLLLREGKKLGLTNEGKRFLQYTKSVLEQMNNIKDEILLLKKPKIKIGFPPLFSSHIIASALKKMNLQEMDVHIIKGTDSNHLINLLLEGDLNLAFVYNKLNHSGITVDMIAENHLVFLVSPNHHLSQHKSLNLHHLKNETMICYIRDSPAWPIIEDRLQNTKINKIETNSSEIVKDLVRMEFGFTILPRFTVNNDDKDLCTRTIEGDFDPSFTQLFAVYKSDSESIEKIETVIRSVKSQIT